MEKIVSSQLKMIFGFFIAIINLEQVRAYRVLGRQSQGGAYKRPREARREYKRHKRAGSPRARKPQVSKFYSQGYSGPDSRAGKKLLRGVLVRGGLG